MGDSPDIAALTDAWMKGEVGPLLPYCEVETPGGDGRDTRLVIETSIWAAIMDEVEGRAWEAQRQREDMRARGEGFRDAKNALDILSAMPVADAAPVYGRIFSD